MEMHDRAATSVNVKSVKIVRIFGWIGAARWIGYSYYLKT